MTIGVGQVKGLMLCCNGLCGFEE